MMCTTVANLLQCFSELEHLRIVFPDQPLVGRLTSYDKASQYLYDLTPTLNVSDGVALHRLQSLHFGNLLWQHSFLDRFTA